MKSATQGYPLYGVALRAPHKAIVLVLGWTRQGGATLPVVITHGATTNASQPYVWRPALVETFGPLSFYADLRQARAAQEWATGKVEKEVGRFMRSIDSAGRPS